MAARAARRARMTSGPPALPHGHTTRRRARPPAARRKATNPRRRDGSRRPAMRTPPFSTAVRLSLPGSLGAAHHAAEPGGPHAKVSPHGVRRLHMVIGFGGHGGL